MARRYRFIRLATLSGKEAFLLVLACVAVVVAAPGALQAKSFWLQNDSAPPPTLSYSDLADIFGTAPIVAEVQIRKVKAIAAAISKDQPQPAVTPPMGRYLIEGDVLALIRAPGPLAPRIRYLIDSPERPGRGKAKTVLIAAAPVAADTTQVQLLSRTAQQATTPALTQRVRSIVAAFAAPDAPPAITGVGSTFFTTGNLPGESESQIFLQTADGAPMSLIVLRRPGARPRWAPAFGDTVKEDAAAPAQDTVGWYRLACGLPASLPVDALAPHGPETRDALIRDYRLILDALGPCGRTLPKG